ncbi:MAG TPA: class I SAM-dependent methyltransferase [Chitinophagaceae bacterium]|nr:class I SAM-dependent methyltransferase [Chitinophagaceae bacterium]
MQNRSITKNIAYRGWFANWFDTSFYHKLYANRNEQEAADFVDALLADLRPAPQARMLDLGCGAGRHSKYLASKGFDVTGIDLAASSIREAQRWKSANCRFYRGDMRVPFGNAAFDHVFSFFTSFGYFTDPQDDHKVLRNIYHALKPDGILAMDYLNSDYTEKRLVAEEDKEIDGITYRISRWSNEKHFFKRIVIEEPLFGKPLEYTEQVKKFSLADFDELFYRNGMKIIDCFGDYRLNPYNKYISPRIILIAKKMN